MSTFQTVLQMILKKFTLTKDDVNILDVNKRSPLHWAGAHGSLDQVKMIAKLGADIGLVDVEGRTALHWAAASPAPRPAQLVAALLSLRPSGGRGSVAAARDHEGHTALQLAARAPASPALVAALAAAPGAEVDAVDHRGRGALHWAAAAGQQEVVAVLLGAGASCGLLDEGGASPWHLAVQGGHLGTVRAMAGAGRPQARDSQHRTPLMWAVALARLDLVPVLGAGEGGGVDCRDQSGYTALHIAAANNVLAALQPLVELGAALELGNEAGETPLVVAARLGHQEVLAALLRCGARPGTTDARGRGALHAAASAGQLTAVQCLVSSPGTELEARDGQGRTALMMASYGGHAAVARLLLEAGAALDRQDGEGMCALHWAVSRGHGEVARLLVEAGAYTNHVARTEAGQLTPLDTALRAEDEDLASLLVAARVRLGWAGLV